MKEPTVPQSSSFARSAFARSKAFSFENAFSMALKSRLSGGSQSKLAPVASIAT